MAGVDSGEDEMPDAKGIRVGAKSAGGRLGLTGRQLNKEWRVGAQHALFHRDGTWYNNLTRFPGALFDPEGYVLFKTEEEYLNCPSVSVGQETNVPRGISSLPGYVRKR